MVICSKFIPIWCSDISLNEVGLATFCETNINLFMFLEQYDLPFNPTDIYLFKVKSRNTILIC